MNAIRNTDGTRQYRMLENFWGSQIRSKAWLINNIKVLFPQLEKNVYIFGGWYGILAQFFNEFIPTVNNIYSIDSDTDCIRYGWELSPNPGKIVFISRKMEDFDNYQDVGIVINTSTEHLEQKTFDDWLRKVPTNVPIVLQGNNLFNCDDHIRCTESLTEFNKLNPLDRVIYTDELECEYHFKRFMTIGYKI